LKNLPHCEKCSKTSVTSDNITATSSLQFGKKKFELTACGEKCSMSEAQRFCFSKKNLKKKNWNVESTAEKKR
jgi:hypothetical protein